MTNTNDRADVAAERERFEAAMPEMIDMPTVAEKAAAWKAWKRRAAISSAVPDGGKDAAELTDTYLAHMAYAGFGIVCDDTEAVQFARFVIAQDRQRRAAPLALPDGGKGSETSSREAVNALQSAVNAMHYAHTLDESQKAVRVLLQDAKSAQAECAPLAKSYGSGMIDAIEDFAPVPATRALTDEQIDLISEKYFDTNPLTTHVQCRNFARAIEQAVNKGAGND